MIKTPMISLICLLCWMAGAREGLALDRRQKQFKTDTAYMALPAPYNVPGIGSGIAYSLIASNILGGYTDILAVKATGVATASYFQVSDFHLISETLILGASKAVVSRMTSNNYKSRGIDSDEKDYVSLVSSLDENLFNVTLTGFERRFSLFYEHSKSVIKVAQGLDPEGELLFEFSNPTPIETQKTIKGFLLDYTDDYLDPLVGLRLDIRNSHSPPLNVLESDFNVVNKSLNIYFPMGKDSTWAFHGIRSDAEVIQAGETDPDKLAQELGLSCSYADCSLDQQSLVNKRQVERQKGTALAIGGFDHLRSFPLERFQGAHSQAFSTEFRWAISDKVTPFNFWIWKDISTKIQWAFFYDTGTVAETTKDLWKKSVSSTGTGLRMVAASGYAYRADVATGPEGENVTMFFFYPW